MHIFLYVTFMGVMGALIGWITNVLAIRLLFRPYKPLRFPVFGWVLQGLIPKRQEDIAHALADLISTELITGEDVAKSLTREDIKEKLAEKVQDHLKRRVLEIIPFLIPLSWQQSLADHVGRLVYQETMALLSHPEKALSAAEKDEVKMIVSSIVEEKVLSFDFQHLEKLVYLLASRELQHIEVLGGVLGFIIGLFQGLFSLLLSRFSSIL